MTLSVDDLGEGFVLKAQTRSPHRCPAHAALSAHGAGIAGGGAGGGAADAGAGSGCLPERERRRVWTIGTPRRSIIPPTSAMHELFEEQVATHSGSRCGGLRRARAELRGVEPAGQSTGALPEAAGSQAGRAGGHLRRAGLGDGGGFAGGAQGRRGVRAAGSGLSQRTAALHA